MSRIVVAGVANLGITMPVDDFPVAYESVRFPEWAHVGVTGVGAHIAKMLQELGDSVDLCTIVGGDAVGDLIRSDLRKHSLLGLGVITGPESSLNVSLVEPDGRRMGQPFLQAVNTVSYPLGLFCEMVRGADLAVLSNTGFARPLLEPAQRMGVPIAVDVHVIADVQSPYNRPWMEVADIIFCSHEGLPMPAESWIAQVLDQYPGCTIAAVGCGARGSMVGLRDGLLIRSEATAPRGVQNTSGAGDTLFASFLHAYLSTGNPVAALRSATVHAGWKIGARVPSEEFLDREGLAELEAAHPVEVTVSRWTAAAA